ncbi:hypothetical protein [uncultured Marinobacter sp.]|uniref:hypothetical protein n=1 Tax=uncultured Marinobacter sp. TaxID=187379 RepID=UPI0026226F4F|nr:hypothetical protein [uncultured Marinobacter sp.]
MDFLSLLIGVGGFSLTAIAMVLTFIFHKSVRPLYLFDISKFGGIEHPEIGITFKGNPVSNLYVLRFVLWNAGKKEIRKEDLPNEKAAPRISFDYSSKVLSNLAYSSTGDDTGNITFSDQNEACLNFDYLNKGDAVIGEIYFSSDDEDNAQFEFLGAVKGAKVKQGNKEIRNATNIIWPLVLSALLVFVAFGSASTTYTNFVNHEFWAATYGVGFSSAVAVASFLCIRFNVLIIPYMVPEQYGEFLEDGLDSKLGKYLYDKALQQTANAADEAVENPEIPATEK